MANITFLDFNNNGTVALGSETTQSESNLIKFGWPTFLERKIYLGIQNSDTELVNAINSAWSDTSDIIIS